MARNDFCSCGAVLGSITEFCDFCCGKNPLFCANDFTDYFGKPHNPIKQIQDCLAGHPVFLALKKMLPSLSEDITHCAICGEHIS